MVDFFPNLHAQNLYGTNSVFNTLALLGRTLEAVGTEPDKFLPLRYDTQGRCTNPGVNYYCEESSCDHKSDGSAAMFRLQYFGAMTGVAN